MKLLLTVQYISDRDSRVMDEVGFRIPRVGFRIPGTGFRIPKLRIPDSKGKKCWIPDSGFPYMERTVLCAAVTEPAGEGSLTLLVYLQNTRVCLTIQYGR